MTQGLKTVKNTAVMLGLFLNTMPGGVRSMGKEGTGCLMETHLLNRCLRLAGYIMKMSLLMDYEHIGH